MDNSNRDAEQLFSEVEKLPDKHDSNKLSSSRAMWRGVLSLDLPALGLGTVEYHLKAAKAHGNLRPVKFHSVEAESGREVVSRVVPKLYHYKMGASGQREDYEEIPYSEAKESVKYKGSDFVSARNERRYFFKDELDQQGKWVEAPVDKVIDKQDIDDEEISPFERTTRIEVEQDGFVSSERVTEYKIKDYYLLNPDTDKKVKESPERVRQLARHLLDKQTALVAFFSWGRGYEYYTAVVFPYERKSDGKLWLLMGMSEGVLQFDEAWSLEAKPETEEAPPVPVASIRKKKPPKVSISK